MLGADRLRVLVLALATLGLLLASALVLDWFEMPIGDGSVAIDLRTAHQCNAAGACVSIPIRGTLATGTLWLSLIYAALVLLQAGTRLLTGAATEAFSRAGYVGGMAVLAAAGATGYFFQPELGVPGLGLLFERTWAPSMMMLGGALGIITMYYAVNQDSDDTRATYVPVIAEARALAPGATAGAREAVPVPAPGDRSAPLVQAPGGAAAPPAAVHAGRASMPIPRPRPVTGAPIPQPLPSPGSSPIPRPTPRQTSQPIDAIPAGLRGKLAFATLTADLSSGGLDARREDGKQLLVLWRDVVGVVARRLPPALDGATFLDIVSTAGATLRVLPWTRLSGDPVAGDDTDRARSLITVLLAHAPHAKLDGATRAFVDREQPALELPDEPTLAEHDQRLA